jgi:hypothetical protein
MTTETQRAAYERIAREHRHDEHEVCDECLQRRHEWLAARELERMAAPAAVEPVAPAVAPEPVAPAAKRPARRVTPTDGYALIEQLQAATDDAARARLLSVAPPRVHAEFRNIALYRQVMQDTDADMERDAAFTRALAAAVGEGARRAVIQGALDDPARGSAWLAEYISLHTASSEDLRKRYLIEACGSEGGS